MRSILFAAVMLAATPGLATTVLTNPGFESGGGTSSITGGAGTGAPSAATGWISYNNTDATTTTAWVPSTDPLTPGGLHMLTIDTASTSGGGNYKGSGQRRLSISVAVYLCQRRCVRDGGRVSAADHQ